MGSVIALLLVGIVGAFIFWLAERFRDNIYGGAFRKRSQNDHLNEYEARMRTDQWTDRFDL